MTTIPTIQTTAATKQSPEQRQKTNERTKEDMNEQKIEDGKMSNLNTTSKPILDPSVTKCTGRRWVLSVICARCAHKRQNKTEMKILGKAARECERERERVCVHALHVHATVASTSFYSIPTVRSSITVCLALFFRAYSRLRSCSQLLPHPLGRITRDIRDICAPKAS